MSGALCASCDRCRARKVKCDGRRPCGACVSLHVKSAAEGGGTVTPSEARRLTCEGVGCVYLPAKRRGPMPGEKEKETRLCLPGVVCLRRITSVRMSPHTCVISVP